MTATGTAFLAGLAVGFYKSKEELKQLRKIGNVFHPTPLNLPSIVPNTAGEEEEEREDKNNNNEKKKGKKKKKKTEGEDEKNSNSSTTNDKRRRYYFTAEMRSTKWTYWKKAVGRSLHWERQVYYSNTPNNNNNNKNSNNE